MDLTAILNSLPAALIPIALVLYFTDQNTKKWAAEKTEIALAILVERKEFLDTQQRLVERYDVRLIAAVEVMSKMVSEMHNLRGTVTEFILRLDNTRRAKE